jgi:hypothetical protein
MAKKRKRKGRIKSKAQRRKFAELLVQGEIKPEVYERWNRAAGGKELPERVHKETAESKAEIQEATRLAETMRLESRRVHRQRNDGADHSYLLRESGRTATRRQRHPGYLPGEPQGRRAEDRGLPK